MRRHINGGLPEIKLTEPNFAGRGIMMLQHDYDGRPLYEPYISDVLASIRAIWNNDVILATNLDNGEETIYYASGAMPEKVDRMSRKRFEAMTE